MLRGKQQYIYLNPVCTLNPSVPNGRTA